MELEKILIKKKDDTLQEYNPNKIIVAINKSAERCLDPLTDEEMSEIVALVENELIQRSNNVVEVSVVHRLVEKALQDVRKDVAESYMNYRNWVKREAEINSEVWGECQSIQFIGEKSNSNADSTLVSTKRVKKLDVLETKQYEHYFLTPSERQACKDGYIYVNDKNARQDTLNCCLFNISAVLNGGFEMNGIWYNKPKTLNTAFKVISDIVLMAASQQYGGFTLPEVDKILEPYAEKSFIKYVNEIKAEVEKHGGKISEADLETEATEKVIDDLMQGFQGWEYKFNTVASSRGDYPFITVSFGITNSKWGREISKACLRVRRGGQGREGFKKPVLFPKLVFLYDENLHAEGKAMHDVFLEGIETSSKTMYPDWLSLTGEGYVPSMYKKYGLVISPMG